MKKLYYILAFILTIAFVSLLFFSANALYRMYTRAPMDVIDSQQMNREAL